MIPQEAAKVNKIPKLSATFCTFKKEKQMCFQALYNAFKKIKFFSKKVLTNPFLCDIILRVSNETREHSSVGRASALQAEGHRFEPYCSHQNGPVVQLVRTLACHARGRGFEPHPGRHIFAS